MLEEDTSFSGLLNYARLFTTRASGRRCGHTFLFLGVALPLELVLGLLLAYLFLERMPGRQVFVALLVLPMVISPIVAGAHVALLFDNRFGPINQILGWLPGERAASSGPSTRSRLPGDPDRPRSGSGRRSCSCSCWRPSPTSTSRSSRPPRSTAPASGVTFRKIVLPAIWPVLAIAVLIRALDLFRLFDIVWALTRGGPGTMTETISIYAYVQGFQQFETSYAAAMAFLDHGHPHRAGDPGAAPDGDRADEARPRPGPGPPLPLAVAATDRLPVPDLLAVRRSPSRRPRRSSPTRRSGGRRRSSSRTTPSCSATATPGRSGTAWSSPRSAPMAAMLLGTLCAYSIARFRTGGDNFAMWIISQPHGAADRDRVPGVPPLRQAGLGRHATSG